MIDRSEALLGAAPHQGPILLVDDEPYVLRWLSHVLTRAGYQVETAVDGEAALARARALRPPLIFLDAKMPRMDGYTVCAELRRDPALAGTHVILLGTGTDGAAAAGEPWSMFSGGPDEYMAKPLRPGDILARTQRALASRAPAPWCADGAGAATSALTAVAALAV
jgi:CheY-like chemotaxis protein